MQFPNALQGVKKIYKAEILSLIAAACIIIAGLLAIVAAAGESLGVVVIAGIFGVASAVLLIIAFIMNIVGVKRASLDEPAFKTAFYVLIIGIIAGIVMGAFQSNSFISGLGNTVSKIMEFLASYYICTGIINLADKLNDSAVSEKGKKVRSMLIIVWLLSAVVGLISGIVSNGSAGSVIGGILAIVGVVACPITSGDTAFRSIRLILAEALHINQRPVVNRVLTALPIFVVAVLVCSSDFSTIWNYVGISNQVLAAIVLWTASRYLYKHGKSPLFTAIPATFLTYVCSCYFMVAPHKAGGLSLPLTVAHIVAAVVTLSIVTIFFLENRHLKRRFTTARNQA